MTVIAEAEDDRSAVQLAAKLSPDIIIMDISMPGLSGVEATRQITAAGTASKIIALSMHVDCRTVLDMVQAGASAYLLKDCAFEELIDAIRSVASNGAYLSPMVADLIFKDFVHRIPGEEISILHYLTSREREVLHLMAEGREPEEIASLLHVSVKTAETHLQQIIFNHIAPGLHRTFSQAPGNENQGAGTTSLTPREREILLWIKEGKSTWEMSSILGITRDTVKFHLKNIFQKLNTSSRSQAVAVAIGNKVIDA